MTFLVTAVTLLSPFGRVGALSPRPRLPNQQRFSFWFALTTRKTVIDRYAAPSDKNRQDQRKHDRRTGRFVADEAPGPSQERVDQRSRVLMIAAQYH